MIKAERLSWLRLSSTFVAVWLSFEMLFPGIGKGEDEFVPTARNYQAQETGSQCSIFRSLAIRAERELAEERERMLETREELKRRRIGLEDCARRRGVRKLKSTEGETLAAELCPQEYALWLQPGDVHQMVMPDMHAERERLADLTVRLQVHCRDLPVPAPVAME